MKGTAGEVTQHGHLVVGLGPGGLGVSYNPYILIQEKNTRTLINLKKHQSQNDLETKH